MQAPLPEPVELVVERTRCVCHVETLVFAPAPWYLHQRMVQIEPVCAGCGKSLLQKTIPEGARWESYALEAVPEGLARAIGQELLDEVTEARKGEKAPAESGPVKMVDRWSEPHEAPPEYVAWVEAQPAAPGLVSREELVEWGTAAAVVAVVVVFCILV